MLDGDDPAVRELLTSSAGAFEDVAKDVKQRLSGLAGLANDGRGVDDSIAEIVDVLSSSRGGLDEEQVTHITEMLKEVRRYGEEAAKTPEKTKIYSVQEQLDAMAQRLFNPQVLKDLTDDLNYGRARGEQLSVDLTVVYDLKAQELPEDGTKIDVPGCIFRLRVLDASNGEMIANDFQMSHVLLKERDPKVSAQRFSIWLKGAIKNAKLGARKEWLGQFVEGDSEKEKEGVLTLGLMENPMRTADWLDTFYSRTVLKWKRAEVARALQGATSPIKTDALEIFSQEADRQGIVHDSVAKEAMVTEIVTLRRQLPVWDRTKVVLNLATQRVTRSVGKPRELTIAQYAAELRRKAGA